ncbi:MAG: acetyl-CoA carboxylase carboxyltransferase subunit alpha [Spirochaetia bacterium]|nr:acetyl-CoA carboxylase carboxyltransferase subunit alpha [Spirochaetia bacterium]
MPEFNFQKKLKELKKMASEEHMHVYEDLSKIEHKLYGGESGTSAWDKVTLARHPERPTALDYIDRVFDNFLEMHGDRQGGDDAALIGGIGFFEGIPVTVLAQQKGRNLKDNLKRNYGMAQPGGYRKALRLAHEAEAFGRPIITFIDTPGAYPGITAEEKGIGEAIARNLKEFSRLQVPIIVIVIGEGGSGGALGIGVGDRVFMLENSVYSVISPEGCASILLRDSSKAKLAAELMRMTSRDLLELGVIHGIISEGEGGAHKDAENTARYMQEVLAQQLPILINKKASQLLKERSHRLLSLGPYYEDQQERGSLISRVFGKR